VNQAACFEELIHPGKAPAAHHLAPARNAPIFDQAPVVMLLAVFEPRVSFEKQLGPRFSVNK
jgi:hypothetical protein